MLNDPRLDLCQGIDGRVTAFAWASPSQGTRWMVVGRHPREVYEVIVSLPVRITTTEAVDPAGSASFDIEEYAADGRKVRVYTLDAEVAG